jgi:hypothetical protein
VVSAVSTDLPNPKGIASSLSLLAMTALSSLRAQRSNPHEERAQGPF